MLVGSLTVQPAPPPCLHTQVTTQVCPYLMRPPTLHSRRPTHPHHHLHHSAPPPTHNTLPAAQFKIMRSWALVCDVYFLEPQTRGEGESAQEFAERVQRLIADRARLKVAPWDGYLKYYNLGEKVRCAAGGAGGVQVHGWVDECGEGSLGQR